MTTFIVDHRIRNRILKRFKEDFEYALGQEGFTFNRMNSHDQDLVIKHLNKLANVVEAYSRAAAKEREQNHRSFRKALTSIYSSFRSKLKGDKQ